MLLTVLCQVIQVNMSFMIKAFADAKEKYGYPKVETGCFTSFPDGK